MSLSQRILSIFFTLSIVFITLLAFTVSVSAATITVDLNNGAINADAQCSLEEAIQNANDDAQTHGDCLAGSGIDTIEFNIGITNETQIISDTDATYEITSPIIFNGLTQGNAFCGAEDDLSDRDLDIELQGITLKFEAGSDGSSVEGMSIIGGETYNAIYLENMSGFDLTCSNLGIDATGTSAPATRDSPIRISNSDNVTIGSAGLELAATNLIAGSNDDGSAESIGVINSDNFAVYGNWFGKGIGPSFNEFPSTGEFLDICGMVDCGGTDLITGVIVEGNEFIGGDFTENGIIFRVVADSVIEDNFFVSFTDSGISSYDVINLLITGNEFFGSESGIGLEDFENVLIYGNKIQNAIESAMYIESGVGLNIINNIISNNATSSIVVVLTDNVFIQRNYIGTDETGMISEGNGYTVGEFPNTGILLLGSTNVIIGGDEASERNVISGNDSENFLAAIAVYIDPGTFASSENVTIQGNYIGVAADGITPLPNNENGYGIFVLGSEILIGGTNPSEYNIIQGGLNGMNIMSAAFPRSAEDVSVLGNKIYNNGGNALDLVYDIDANFYPDTLIGPNPNDAGDTDEGPGYIDYPSNNLNHLLNYPEFTSYHTTDITTNIEYILDVPAGDYRIEFFQNSVLTDYGEGETFLTYQDITHTGSGEETFTINLPVTVGDHIAATATERNQATFSTFGATSEFSASATIIQTPVTTPRRTSSGGSVQQSVSNLQNQGKTEQAQELKDQFPHLFDNETPTIESLTKKLAELQALLAQLQSSPNTLSCTPSLKRGSTGEQVRILQTKLNITPTDGIFGPKTEQSVRTFQQHKNLLVDGVVGVRTCALL